jgi:hypothetical protein
VHFRFYFYVFELAFILFLGITSPSNLQYKSGRNTESREHGLNLYPSARDLENSESVPGLLSGTDTYTISYWSPTQSNPPSSRAGLSKRERDSDLPRTQTQPQTLPQPEHYTDPDLRPREEEIKISPYKASTQKQMKKAEKTHKNPENEESIDKFGQSQALSAISSGRSRGQSGNRKFSEETEQEKMKRRIDQHLSLFAQDKSLSPNRQTSSPARYHHILINLNSRIERIGRTGFFTNSAQK